MTKNSDRFAAIASAVISQTFHPEVRLYCNSQAITVVRSPRRYRPFLIFIRAGSEPRPSLFAQSLPDDRLFDVAVNYYATPHESDWYADNAEFHLAGGLSKYQAAKQLLYSGILDAYKGVYFLDADVELHFDPSVFLHYCEQKGFALAQASLTAASDGAWRITFNHPSFEYRLTNFVEVMAPYISRDFLMNVVEQFDLTVSTYGLDVYWGSQLGSNDAAAVVDSFQMSHRQHRNLTSGAFYSYLRSIGVDCIQEMKGVLEMLGVPAYEIRFRGGVEIVEAVRVGPAEGPGNAC